jgi:hypothetical protein
MIMERAGPTARWSASWHTATRMGPGSNGWTVGAWREGGLRTPALDKKGHAVRTHGHT